MAAGQGVIGGLLGLDMSAGMPPALMVLAVVVALIVFVPLRSAAGAYCALAAAARCRGR
jgi:hypothetical protein